MRNILSLIILAILISACSKMGESNGDNFYDPLPYSGKKGDVLCVYDTMWRITLLEEMDRQKPHTISYTDFDNKGRVDSIHIYQATSEKPYMVSIKNFYEGKDKIRTWTKYSSLEKEVESRVSETVYTWKNGHALETHERDLCTNKTHPSWVYEYDKKKKAVSTSNPNINDVASRTVDYYKDRQIIKSDVFTYTSITHTTEYEYNEAGDLLKTIGNMANFGNNNPDITIYQYCDFDEYNNWQESKEFYNNKLKAITRVRIKYK